MDTWRYLINHPFPAAWNMAADEAILESVVKGDAPPTLRFYAWKPFALSLGRTQKYAEVNQQALDAHGWDVVRRPTGGKAILHADELTYSVCAPEDDPHVSGNVLKSYRMLSRGLLKGFELAGIPADSQPNDEKNLDRLTNPVCFQYPSDYEITCGGKKLIGSAQARLNNGVLQHGAIPLSGDICRVIEVLAFKSDTQRQAARDNLRDHATTLEACLGHTPDWEHIADCIREGFAQALDLRFEKGSLLPAEKARAFQLWQEKYAHPDWTQRI
ncbi:MAG: lipoyl(octanoyl) transferase [Chloroflexota bacterium]|nr:lipoyl(octanoyl) transferase [Chloroflexota bacterium]